MNSIPLPVLSEPGSAVPKRLAVVLLRLDLRRLGLAAAMPSRSSGRLPIRGGDQDG